MNRSFTRRMGRLTLATVLFTAWLIASASLTFSQEPNVQSASIPIDWSSIGQHSNQIAVTEEQGTISILAEGSDPYFRFQMPALPKSTRDWILELEYFCAQGITRMEWRSGPGIHRPPAAALPDMPSAEGWTTYTLNLNQIAPSVVHANRELPIRIDLGNTPGIRLQVRSVVVRPMNSEELRRRSEAEHERHVKEELATQIDRYQSRTWIARIESIGLDAGDLHLIGSIMSDDTDASLIDSTHVIARAPASISAVRLTDQETIQKWPVVFDRATRRFQAAIPAAEGSPWMQPGTRFQLVHQTDGQWQPMSPAVYPPPVFDQHASLRQASPQTKPLHAAKGLTCITNRFSSQQLVDLGLEHASVNLVVSGLVSRTERPGWERVKVHGQWWWVNEPRLKQQDRDIRTASDAGIIVAAILLIPNSPRNPAPIAHPQASAAGTYAMPNLNDPQAVEQYAAALEVLARRYSGSFPQHGRLDHWIVHNEVDYGWQWTNMGEQPMDVFMDHYVRSMRLVDSAARRHNPHARVFVSLTHRWNTVDNQHWKTYAPKKMLQWLIHDSHLEGDFPWGIAYHPYPQSLWKADFWNDRKVTDDFDTELITIKNLQVLDRFMHLDSTRTATGDLRAVICSEQGFHADENDPEQLETQAAALLLTWQKLRQCPSILAFDYHRPSDHPNEGGLRLGLRGLPSNEDRLGKPKPAWEVYSAIGTDRESEFVRRYRSVWESK
ncbi:MAG: hypothetical protein KDB00_06495 [Planctomycetales bacterium]|nr:hypothetical protein [Planctomycetales bacterium]